MKSTLRTSVAMLAIMTLLTGVAYPLLVTGVAQLALAGQANGGVVFVDGRPVGSSHIGQAFSDPGHFWGRPSATSPVPYNAASSSGSNLGPLNPALVDNVRGRIDELRKADPGLGPVPVDLVTSSGSGLDPHISPAAAEAQVRRVATARGLPESQVREIVARHTEGRQFGVLGEPRVNVLLLNLALEHPGEDRTARAEFNLPSRHTLPAESRDELRTYIRLDDILGRGQPGRSERSEWSADIP